MRHPRLPILLAALVLAGSRAVAPAAVVTAAGYASYTIPLPGAPQGGVARAGEAVFVGQGAFGAGTQRVVRVDGATTTVLAQGFNSLGGFDYDAAGDVLWVVDNGGELAGAVTGDTLYAIPDASTRTTAAAAGDVEALAAGSIASPADVVLLSGGGVLVSDSVGPGAGRVVRVEGDAVTPLVTGLDYAAGIALTSDGFVVGNSDASFVGAVYAYGLDGAPRGPRAQALSGAYGVALDADGVTVLVSGGRTEDGSSGTVVAVGPGGAVVERARGFAFSADIARDAERGETLVLDFGVPAVTVICPDGDADGLCDADDPPGTTTTTTSPPPTTTTSLAGATTTSTTTTTTSPTTTTTVPCLGAPLPARETRATRAGRPDSLVLSGRLPVAVAGKPSLDLLADGLRVRLDGASGPVLDVAIPPGAYDDRTGQGWRAAPRRRLVWRSRDGIAGIRRVVLRAVRGGGLVAAVRARGIRLRPEDLPLTLGLAVRVSGTCSEGTLEQSCRFDPHRRRTSCRALRGG